MERAREQGKRIGRPSVTERDGFPQRFAAVVERLEQGEISRRQAAREMAIGYATLNRLLDARRTSEENKQRTLVAVTAWSDGNDYDDIMATLLTKSLNSKP
jgi:DNA invertase Pin-like site-specific DNA recombinase